VGHIARSNIVDGPGDRDGSRNMPRVVGLVQEIFALSCAFAWSVMAFVSRRLLAAITIGGLSMLAPIFPE
jgi:hypothetical protein